MEAAPSVSMGTWKQAPHTWSPQQRLGAPSGATAALLRSSSAGGISPSPYNPRLPGADETLNGGLIEAQGFWPCLLGVDAPPSGGLEEIECCRLLQASTKVKEGGGWSRMTQKRSTKACKGHMWHPLTTSNQYTTHEPTTIVLIVS